MAQKRVVLITGVTSDWGERVATRLLSESALHLIGLDVKPPRADLAGLDFIEADGHNPLLGELLQVEQVDTVCHLSFVESTFPQEPAFNINVIGTMKLLGACAQANVRKVIVKSSTAVYGARPTNSAFLAEDQPLDGDRRYGYCRDLIEIETYIENFAEQVPDMIITRLRFGNIVGPTVDSPMTRFLKSRQAPALLGFDPMTQLIHEDDVVAALVQAILDDFPGVYNVAAPDPIPLWRLISLTGKLPLALPYPLAERAARSLRRRRTKYERFAPLPLSYLRYPWVGDTTKMSDELGFFPEYTAVAAAQSLHQRGGRSRTNPTPSPLDIDEARLRQTIETRRRARADTVEERE